MVDFNLSDKIKQFDDLEEYVEIKDVKEFIKELKRKHICFHYKKGTDCRAENRKIIDKLAGDKLNNALEGDSE